MKLKYILISLSVLIFLSLNFGLKPYLKRQKAITTVKEILNLWVKGDLMSSSVYWKKKQEYPPLYGILSYKITETKFYKENQTDYVRISAKLKFTSNNIYADKKDWTFILERKVALWQVINFYSSDNPPEEN